MNEEQERRTVPDSFNFISSLSAGLIWNDAKWIIVSLLLLSFLPLISVSLNVDLYEGLAFQLAQRLVELIVLGSILKRTASGLGVELNFKFGKEFVIAGYLVWFSIFGGLYLALNGQNLLGALGFILFFLGALISVKYFFYHYFLLAGNSYDFKELLQRTEVFSRSNIGLIIKTVWLSFVLSSLLTSVLFSLDPFQQSVTTMLLNSFFGGIYWVISAYLSSVVCLVKENSIQEIEFEGLRPPKFFRSIFSIRKSFVFLLITILLYLFSFYKLANQPPPASFAVIDSRISDNSLVLDLNVNEFNVKSKGFNPYGFSIASLKGTFLNPDKIFPIEVRIEDLEYAVYIKDRKTLPESFKLNLTFETGKTAKVVSQKGDLYLWYLNNKILHLELASSRSSE